MVMIIIIIIVMLVVVVVVLGDLGDAVHSGWGDDGFLHAQVRCDHTAAVPSSCPSHRWACVDRTGTYRRGVLHHVVSRTHPVLTLHMYVLPSYVQHSMPYMPPSTRPRAESGFLRAPSTINPPPPVPHTLSLPSDRVSDDGLLLAAVSLMGWSHRDFWTCVCACACACVCVYVCV